MSELADDEFVNTMVNVQPRGGAATTEVGHYLEVLEGSEPGQLIEVVSGTLTVGRDPRQGLVFADSELSRVHARISLVMGELVTEDLGSTNGTFVDGVRIIEPTLLREGSVLRVGRQVLKYDRRVRREVARREELTRDLRKASNYVLSLLPSPREDGPVRVDWRFVPSAVLGGDAFGYHWLAPDTFVLYLIDVSGHGVGAAMHSVAVLNVLRQRALPHVDFANPSDVLANLNNRFQMESHDGMFLTAWYGVYDLPSRSLTYGTAGHHAAYLVSADRQATIPLGVPHLMIGAMPDVEYERRQVVVAPGSTMYLFSDGVFEVVTKQQEQWSLSEFVPHLLGPPLPDVCEPERLHRVVQDVARPGGFDDDFSLMSVTFV